MMILLVCISIIVTAVNGQLGPAQSEVAFSAGLSHNILLQHAETVVYDKVFTNVGSGYNTATGIFNCPQSGIYVFQFHMLAQQTKASWLELYHNAEYIASAFGHTGNDYASAGNTVILTLTKGDTVLTRAVDSGFGASTEMYGKVNEVYCTFSGYMVSPVYIDVPGKK